MLFLRKNLSPTQNLPARKTQRQSINKNNFKKRGQRGETKEISSGQYDSYLCWRADNDSIALGEECGWLRSAVKGDGHGCSLGFDCTRLATSLVCKCHCSLCVIQRPLWLSLKVWLQIQVDKNFKNYNFKACGQEDWRPMKAGLANKKSTTPVSKETLQQDELSIRQFGCQRVWMFL